MLTRRLTTMALATAVLLPSPSRGQPAPRTGASAPEFRGISGWLNSPPLTLASLRGKVVLVDFWAYSCINCLRTLPYLTGWYDKYKDRGLVVVGVHTPEFAFERVTANLQKAIARFGIHYPVAQDNDDATWSAYANQYWPAEYLIDRNGNIVLTHVGEGNYDEMENAIRSLLAAGPAIGHDDGADLSRIGSPEMYFGLARLAMLASLEAPQAAETRYTAPSHLPANRFALVGRWRLAPEYARLSEDGGGVRLNFNAGKVFMVASSATPVTLSVRVDGKPQPEVTVRESRLYTLFKSEDYGSHLLSLDIPKAGLQAFTFTFG